MIFSSLKEYKGRKRSKTSHKRSDLKKLTFSRKDSSHLSENSIAYKEVLSLLRLLSTVNCLEYQTIKADYQTNENSQCQK